MSWEDVDTLLRKNPDLRADIVITRPPLLTVHLWDSKSHQIEQATKFAYLIAEYLWLDPLDHSLTTSTQTQTNAYCATIKLRCVKVELYEGSMDESEWKAVKIYGLPSWIKHIKAE